MEQLVIKQTLIGAQVSLNLHVDERRALFLASITIRYYSAYLPYTKNSDIIRKNQN